MINKNESPRRNNNQNGYSNQSRNNAQGQAHRTYQNQARDNSQTRENSEPRENPRENNQSKETQRDNSQPRDNGQQREREHRGYYRDNASRQTQGQGHSGQTYQRYQSRVRAEETTEDIKADIVRIEKEIELEIKEIKTMRLGL